jgi:hypothetical protein
MHSDSKRTILGMYAIYFHSLTEAITQRRKDYFWRNISKSRERLRAHDPNEKTWSAHRSVLNNPDKPIHTFSKLEAVVKKAQNILVKSTAMFPFQLFPDTITIDRQKLTVVHRDFFTTKQTVSVQFSDIKNIQADIGPFFGSLTVTSEHFINNTQTIKNLPKQEVLKIQQLVQGFIIAHKENVDLSEIGDHKLVELLNQLGRGEAGEPVIKPAV